MISLRLLGLVVADVRNSSTLKSFPGWQSLSHFIRGQNLTPGHQRIVENSHFVRRTLHHSCSLLKETSFPSKQNSGMIQKGKKIDLSPASRPVVAKELGKEQRKQKGEKQVEKTKSAKSLKLSSTIASHDLGVKTKHVIEWLEKGFEVKVTISSGKSVEGETRVFDHVTSACRELAKIQNSKKTEQELVFLLTPKTLDGTAAGNVATDRNIKPLKLQELKLMQSSEEEVETDASKK